MAVNITQTCMDEAKALKGAEESLYTQFDEVHKLYCEICLQEIDSEIEKMQLLSEGLCQKLNWERLTKDIFLLQLPPPKINKNKSRSRRVFGLMEADEFYFLSLIRSKTRRYQEVIEYPFSLLYSLQPLALIRKVNKEIALLRPVDTNTDNENDNNDSNIDLGNVTVESRLVEIQNQLQEVSGRLMTLVKRADEYKLSDPESSLNQARKAAELICKELYDDSDESGRPSNSMTLNELMEQLERRGVISKITTLHLRTVRDYGNFGSHDQGEESLNVTSEMITPCLAALICLGEWWVKRSNFNR